MTYRLLADSGCNDGTCPTFFLDDETGDVIVRGYDTTNPTLERDIRIPAAQWTHLVSQLPR
jgi:hypothetical protein